MPGFAELPESWLGPPGLRNQSCRSRNEKWRRIWLVKQILTPYFSCQDLFAKIAEATGESLESVCQMQEAERNGLVEVLKLQQVGFDNSLP